MRQNLAAAALCAAASALAFSAQAAPDYSFLEGGYVSIDRGRNDDSGLRFGGSFNVAPRVALIGEFADADDYSQLSAGVLLHTPLSGAWDFVAGATLEDIDTGRNDDTGFGLRAGARARLAGNRLQLEPEVRLVDAFEDTRTSLRLGAAFDLGPQLALAGALQGGDDDRFELGVRYRF